MNHNKHKQKTLTGVKWNMLNQVFVQLTTFGVGILLMRILEPKEFGLIGMVTIFSGFIAVFKDFGLANSLIQKEKIDEVDKNTVFYTANSIGLLLTILLFFGSTYIALFYKEPRLENLAKVLALNFFIQSLGSTHNTLLLKEINFKKIFYIKTTSVVVAGLIALYLALNNYGVWTLVYQQLIISTVGSILLWTFLDWRPSLQYSKSSLKHHLKFGIPLMGTNTFNYWARSADNLLIGKFLGSQALGFYSRAYTLMMVPVSQISRVISGVMMPSLSLIQSDKKRVKAIYLKVSRVIALITFPMMGILFVVADPLVHFVFGSKWSAIIFLLKIFSFIGAVQSIATLNGIIYLSQGRTLLQFKVNIFVSITTVLGFALSVKYGINTMAIVYLIVVIFNLFPSFYFMGNIINLSLKEIFLNVMKILIITMCLTLLGSYFIDFISTYPEYLQIIITAVLYIALWALLMKKFAYNLFNEFLSLIHHFKRKQ